jgi:hypothetical protein
LKNRSIKIRSINLNKKETEFIFIFIKISSAGREIKNKEVLL